jgi:hypothetical protein
MFFNKREGTFPALGDFIILALPGIKRVLSEDVPTDELLTSCTCRLCPYALKVCVQAS